MPLPAMCAPRSTRKTPEKPVSTAIASRSRSSSDIGRPYCRDLGERRHWHQDGSCFTIGDNRSRRWNDGRHASSARLVVRGGRRRRCSWNDTYRWEVGRPASQWPAQRACRSRSWSGSGDGTGSSEVGTGSNRRPERNGGEQSLVQPSPGPSGRTDRTRHSVLEDFQRGGLGDRRTTENTGFTCAQCSAAVDSLSNGGYRNHCPHCSGRCTSTSGQATALRVPRSDRGHRRRLPRSEGVRRRASLLEVVVWNGGTRRPQTTSMR